MQKERTTIRPEEPIQSRKISNFEKAFYFIWGIYAFTYMMFSASELSFMYNLSNYQRAVTNTVILCLLLLLFMMHRFSQVEFVKYAIFIVFIALIEISITDKGFLVCTLFMIAAQKIDFNKFVKFDMKLKLAIFLLIISLCQIGVIDNFSVAINGVYKQSMGFSHPNTFTCYAYTLILEWMCVRFRDMRFFEWILQGAFGLLIFAIGGGRSSGYTFFVIYILFVIEKIRPQIFSSKLVYFIFTIITPLMAALSFIASWLYSKGNVLMIALDQVFTTRISQAARFLATYDINLFGQEIETIGSRRAQLQGVRSLILDCAYVRCLLMYGVLFFLLFIMVYVLMLRKFLKSGQITLGLFALFFVILGLGEAYMLNVLYNITLLCFLGTRNTRANDKPNRYTEIKVGRRTIRFTFGK